MCDGSFYWRFRFSFRWNRGAGTGDVFLVVDDGGGFHACRDRGLGGCGSESGLAGHTVQIGIHNNLAVIAEIDRFQFVELLTPLLDVGDVGLVARQKASGAEVDEDVAVGVRGDDFYVFGIADVDFAEFLGVAGSAGIEVANQSVVVFHARGASRERLSGVHAGDYGERILVLAAGSKFHQRSSGVDERDVGTDAGEGYGSAFVDLDAEAVGDKAHHAGGFDPGNLFELLLTEREGDKENVAADVAAHHVHDLGVGNVRGALNFDLIAGIDAEAPGMLSVVVESEGGGAENYENEERQGDPLQAIGSFFREGSSADGDTLLPAQEGRFLLSFEVDEPRVIESVPVGSFVGKRVEFFLNRGGTRFPRHSLGSIVDRKPLSKVTITAFRAGRQCEVGSNDDRRPFHRRDAENAEKIFGKSFVIPAAASDLYVEIEGEVKVGSENLE